MDDLNDRRIVRVMRRRERKGSERRVEGLDLFKCVAHGPRIGCGVRLLDGGRQDVDACVRLRGELIRVGAIPGAVALNELLIAWGRVAGAPRAADDQTFSRVTRASQNGVGVEG